MKPIILSFVYEILIWNAYFAMPCSIWDGSFVGWGIVVGIVQIVVYFISAKIGHLLDESSRKKHFSIFVVVHIVITILFWLIVREGNVNKNVNYNVPFEGLVRTGNFLGGEVGMSALFFGIVSGAVTIGVGVLIQKISGDTGGKEDSF